MCRELLRLGVVFGAHGPLRSRVDILLVELLILHWLILWRTLGRLRGSNVKRGRLVGLLEAWVAYWLLERIVLGRNHRSRCNVLRWLCVCIGLHFVLSLLAKVVVELLVVWEEDWVIEPEVAGHFHRIEDLLHILMQVIAHGPHANCSICGAKSEILAIRRKPELCHLEDRGDFCSWHTCANLIHQNGVSLKLLLV